MCDVFISYSHADGVVAQRLTSSLRQAGFDVFIDEDIAAGEAIMTAVDSVIEGARAVVVLWSSSSRQSPYVQGEIMAARELGTLVPVLIDDTPISTFVRSVRFRRLVMDGAWSDRGFHELRQDLLSRCRRSEPPVTPPSLLASPTRPRGAVPSQPLRATAPSQAAEPACSDAVFAIRRVLGVIDGLSTLEALNTDTRSRLMYATGLGSDACVLAAMDLSVSRMRPCFLVLLGDRLMLAGAGSSATVSYAAIIGAPINVVKEGYGLSAQVLTGRAVLEVTGSVQTNALLEVLYAIREEFGWMSPS